MPKKEKKQASKPLLKEQDQIDLELQVAEQEHTSEAGFHPAEETLALSSNVDKDDSWLWSGKADEPLAQGTLVDQKYEIIMRLGIGGMGSVYLAKHRELGTQVALKVLHRHLVSTPSALERFKTEARAAHTLSSKNLVSVLDYGVLADGQPYLTMHCIDGINLADYLKSKGTLSIGETFSVVRQVAAALEEAHSKGIVHRDIKPSNILIEGNTIKEGAIKVVDFGIAKALSDQTSNQQVTHTGQIFGSPFYMSPEQCKGNALDFRTDLYSLGCVMFECLTGSWPFPGSNAIETMMMHCNETPPTLGVKGKPPKGFQQAKLVLKKLLAKDPAQRYQNAAALSEALQGFEVETSEQKLFAFGRAQAGDKRFKEEMARIVFMLMCLCFLYFFLAANMQNRTTGSEQAIKPMKRLEELFRLANVDSIRTYGTKDPETDKYLIRAIVFADENFGAESQQAAEAHNRRGCYLSELYYRGENSLQDAKNELAWALEITDRWDKKPGVKPTLSHIKQKYILDLAILEEDFKKAEKLFDRALSLGPFPLDKPGQVGHWYNYQRSLEREGRYVEAARNYIDMETQRKKIPLPSVEELSAQKVDSVLGKFAHMKNHEKSVEDFKLTLEAKNNMVVGRYSIKPISYSHPSVFSNPGPIGSHNLKGNFANGVLHCTLSYKGNNFPYFITRVGEYLVILDKPRSEPPSVSDPAPPDAILLIEE